MERLQRLFGSAAGMGQGMQPGMDTPTVDNAEMVYISSLALLKVCWQSDILKQQRHATQINADSHLLSADAQAWLVEELGRHLGMHCTRSNLVTILSTGRAGVPMEVMGLMLGEFVDDYTVRVIDVFAMPQSGTGVSVEAVDPVFQTKMLDMLKQTGRYVPD